MPSATLYKCEWLFRGEGEFEANQAVVVDDARKITAVGRYGQIKAAFGDVSEIALSGLVLPGLINAHTHLELSALQGKVPGGRGFFPWVQDLLKARAQLMAEEEDAALSKAVNELVAGGTVAVGDISNSLKSVFHLSRKGLAGSVFHEVYGYRRQETMARLEGLSKDLMFEVGTWPEGNLRYAPAPHTLYTTHGDVLRALMRRVRKQEQLTSIHLLEHPAERQFVEAGEGPVLGFAGALGIESAELSIPRKPVLEYAEELGLLAPKTLLVHLTCIEAEELEKVAKSGASVVLCPRSNLHIELRLPPALALVQAGIKPALGSDSLASNQFLEVLMEAKALHERFPAIGATRLFSMATAWGADALCQPGLGRIEKGKAPGLVQISGSVPENADKGTFWLRQPASKRRLVVPSEGLKP